MPLDPKRVQAVFLEAANCHDLADRAAILDRECMDDSESRKRIEALLRAHDRFNDFVNQPLVGPMRPGYAVIPGSRNSMRSTPFITTPYTIDQIIDEYVFYLIEQPTRSTTSMVSPSSILIIELSVDCGVKPSEPFAVSWRSEPVESLNSRGMNKASRETENENLGCRHCLIHETSGRETARSR
jgi:hypothetical protein